MSFFYFLNCAVCYHLALNIHNIEGPCKYQGTSQLVDISTVHVITGDGNVIAVFMFILN